MKKTLALLMALAMILCLCACGAAEESPAPAPTEAPAASDSDTQPAPAADDSSSNVVIMTAPAGSGLNEEKFTKAEQCIGQSVEDLIEAIGEPNRSEYSSSCLVENAEDGILYYDDYGFYVFSLKDSDGSETVQSVLEL